MAEHRSKPKSSLRNNIMIAFFLAIVLFGVALTATSHYVLRRALGEADVSAEVTRHVGRHFIQVITGFTIVGVVLALAIADLISRTITEPIRRLLSGVTRISAGELGTRIDLANEDEFGRLARAFNDMAYRLQESHETLEEKVCRRTAEISAVNETLEREIAVRAKVEAELRESLSLLEATLESTADGILVVDGRGKIKNYNRQFQEIWQLPDDTLSAADDNEALNAAVPKLSDPDGFRATVRSLYRRPAKEGHGLLGFRDGRIIEYYSKPQSVDTGIVGRVWSFRDVTEKHNAARKQAALLCRVAEINEELSHFAYVVSHDLKAPLRGVKMITEWLCEDYGRKLGAEAREQLDLLQSRVERMHNLIDGVLQYSRIGRIREEMTEIDLNRLIPDIVDTLAPPESVRVTIEDALPTIEGEPTRVTQVFQNLLANAVQYMDKPQGRIAVACVEQGDVWQFSVADNGPGIEEKHFERIFRIFQTLAPRDETESTGVGLTLVKKIVEMYGGKVWVESEAGRGATFFFTLPREQTLPREETVSAAAGR
jgi:signal transduction histidine kinase/HAMP domain-containing protein